MCMANLPAASAHAASWYTTGRLGIVVGARSVREYVTVDVLALVHQAEP
jgi:hypothetical protein